MEFLSTYLRITNVLVVHLRCIDVCIQDELVFVTGLYLLKFLGSIT